MKDVLLSVCVLKQERPEPRSWLGQVWIIRLLMGIRADYPRKAAA